MQVSKIIKEKLWFLPAVPRGRELKQRRPGCWNGLLSQLLLSEDVATGSGGHESLFLFPHGWFLVQAALLEVCQLGVISQADLVGLALQSSSSTLCFSIVF